MLAWKGGKRRRLESQDRPRFPKTPGGSHEKTHVVIEERPSAKEEPGAKEEPAKAVAHERAASRLATSAYEEMLVESCRPELHQSARSAGGGKTAKPGPWGAQKLSHRGGQGSGVSLDLQRLDMDKRERAMRRAAESAAGGDAEGSGQ